MNYNSDLHVNIFNLKYLIMAVIYRVRLSAVYLNFRPYQWKVIHDWYCKLSKLYMAGEATYPR